MFATLKQYKDSSESIKYISETVTRLMAWAKQAKVLQTSKLRSVSSRLECQVFQENVQVPGPLVQYDGCYLLCLCFVSFFVSFFVNMVSDESENFKTLLL